MTRRMTQEKAPVKRRQVLLADNLWGMKSR